jgi:hypothetical protein
MLGEIIYFLFIVLDLVFSIWNSYNAGQIFPTRRGIGELFYIFGGLLPMSYVASAIVSFFLGYLGYISLSTFYFILSFNFLFFGLTFIIWGIIATLTSIMAFRGSHNWIAGLVAGYDAFVTIFDAWDYISGFMSSWKDIRRSMDSSDFSVLDVIVILLIAFGIGFVISYTAFKQGQKSSRISYYW